MFVKRAAKGIKTSVAFNKNLVKLLATQKGMCPVCSSPLLADDSLEVHHIMSRKQGGDDKLKNLLLLHKTCHVQITHSKSKSLRASWIKRGLLSKDD